MLYPYFLVFSAGHNHHEISKCAGDGNRWLVRDSKLKSFNFSVHFIKTNTAQNFFEKIKYFVLQVTLITLLLTVNNTRKKNLTVLFSILSLNILSFSPFNMKSPCTEASD